MKKLFPLVFFLFYGIVVFGQRAVLVNPVKDTVKAKWGKVKMVDGAAMNSANNFVENMALSKEYTTLVNAIENAGLTETFKSKGPITVFAPTNKAFGNLPAGQLDTLLKSDHKLDLSYLLTYHAIAGRVTARDIEKKINANNGQATFTTLAGSKITAKIDTNRNIVLIDENGGESIISKFDVQQSNGLLHVVTAVLVPKPRAI